MKKFAFTLPTFDLYFTTVINLLIHHKKLSISQLNTQWYTSYQDILIISHDIHADPDVNKLDIEKELLLLNPSDHIEIINHIKSTFDIFTREESSYHRSYLSHLLEEAYRYNNLQDYYTPSYHLEVGYSSYQKHFLKEKSPCFESTLDKTLNDIANSIRYF